MRKRQDPAYVKYALEQVGYDSSVVDEELSRIQSIQTGQPLPPQAQNHTNPGGAQIGTAESANLGDAGAANSMLDLLDKSVQDNKDLMGPIEGRARSLNPYDTQAQTIQGQINATKQIVGKYLEGGVLRAEDEVKYAKILPTLNDTPETAKNKLDTVRKLIEQKKKSQLESFGQAGYDTSQFQETPQQTTQPSSGQLVTLNTPEEAAKWLQSNPTDPRADQVKKKLESVGFDMNKLAQTSQNTNTQQGGFLGDVSKSFTDRTNNIADTLNSGDSTGSKILQTTGQELGFFSDSVGSAVVNTLKAVTPDFIEKPAKEKITELVSAGLNTDVAKKTITAWEDFKQSNPEMARNIEATGNIANFFALGYGSGAGAKVAKEGIGAVASKTGKALEASGVKAGAEAAQKYAQELVMPIDSKAARLDQVGRTTETGIGPFKKNVVAPTAAEQRSAQEIMKIEGVSPSNTYQQNYNAIKEAVRQKADDLITALSANDFIVSKKEVLSRLNKAAEGLKSSPLIVGEAEKMAEKLLAGAKRFINENSGTGSGMLKARKAYDEWVLKQKPKAFDAKAENAFSVANREVRNAINKLLDEKAPNVGVKESFRQQSSLLDALDNIAPKAAEEAKTAVGRALQNLGSKIGSKNKIIQSIAAAGIGLGGGTIATMAPGVAIAGGAAYGAYKAGKALLSPALRKGLGKILQESGHLLNPEDLKVLEEIAK